jgi:hypothetical protein
MQGAGFGEILFLGCWVNRALALRSFVLPGDHGEDQHVPRPSVRADLGIAQLALEPKPGALRDPHAAAVVRVAADLDASGA